MTIELSTFEDIKSLWELGQRETLNLEFKSELPNNPDEIAKDVSSFANSEGGIIVYGSSEDTHGKATKSEGLQCNKNSERIQQIVASSIAPPLDIKILAIDARNDEDKALSNTEFLIVKIPKSHFYIHQVTTTGKFYIRNNTITTPYKYEPQEMKENDISLRYEMRIKSKTDQQNLFNTVEKQIIKRLDHPTPYIFLIATPQVYFGPHIEVSKDLIKELLSTNGNSRLLVYEKLSCGDFLANTPTGDGREGYYRYMSSYLKFYNNRTVVYIRKLLDDDLTGKIQSSSFVQELVEFLHLYNRFLRETNYYGGTSVLIKFVKCGNTKVEIGNGIYDVTEDWRNEISAQEDMYDPPIDVKKTVLNLSKRLVEKTGRDIQIENQIILVKSIDRFISNAEKNISN